MAVNENVNKVVLADGRVLIDLTQDSVTQGDVLAGVTVHLPSGEQVEGTCTYDADTSDATAAASEILVGQTAYKNGTEIIGTMPDRGQFIGSIEDLSTPVQIPNGYHDGSGYVGIYALEAYKLIPSNIKSGIQILGVTGEYAGEPTTAQQKDATAYLTPTTILPDFGYDYLSQVNVQGITITETDNLAGGVTVTIGDVDPDA